MTRQSPVTWLLVTRQSPVTWLLVTWQGGIKAVVWTDAFQMLVILAGFLTLVIRGTLGVGGLGVVMARAHEGGRFSWDLE